MLLRCIRIAKWYAWNDCRGILEDLSHSFETRIPRYARHDIGYMNNCHFDYREKSWNVQTLVEMTDIFYPLSFRPKGEILEHMEFEYKIIMVANQ